MSSFNIFDLITSSNPAVAPTLVDNICFNVDVRKTLYSAYTDIDLKTPSTTEALSSNSLYTLINYLLERAEKSGDIKALNTLFKINDGIIKNVEPPIFSDATQQRMNTLLREMNLPKPNPDEVDSVNVVQEAKKIIAELESPERSKNNEQKSIDAVFIAWPGPVSRAYLYVLKCNNMQPKKLIIIRPKKSFKRKIIHLLPSFFLRLLEPLFGKKIIPNFTPATIDIFNEKAKSLTSLKLTHRDFCTKITAITSKDINGKSVIKAAQPFEGNHVIFTGGGIIKGETLKQIDKKFLHMHPGKLPDVRGADGFFWSAVLKGYISVSAIYQNEGIDTGNILTNADFNIPSFNLGEISRLGDNYYDTVYHSILSEYDPWMRALTLQKLITESNGDLNTVSSSKLKIQQKNEGRNYHFMHRKIRNRVIDLLLEDKMTQADKLTANI